MYTALAIERELRARSVAADFRATGQTGILIAGSGVAVDAVVSDFVAAAAASLSPAAADDHWDIVEGQGSIFHPRSEENTSEIQSLMRISYAGFCLKKNKNNNIVHKTA